MAGSAKKDEIVAETAGLPEVLDQHEAIRRHCAKLYGLGLQRREIARAMLDYLAPDKEMMPDQRLAAARAKLRRWEKQDRFRDMVYSAAVVQLDMESPKILSALGRQAKRGKVDAAKFVLELTGRYSSKGDQQPTSVAVIIGGVPRPGVTAEQLSYDVDQDDGSEETDEDQDEG